MSRCASKRQIVGRTIVDAYFDTMLNANRVRVRYLSALTLDNGVKLLFDTIEPHMNGSEYGTVVRALPPRTR